MDNNTLKELDKKRALNTLKVSENRAYVKGRNPITLNEPAKKKPDNRLTIPYAKIAVDSMCGYAGRAGDIQLFWENLSTQESEVEKGITDDYIDIQRFIADYNKEPVETSELYHEAVTQGVAYEIMWVSEGDIKGGLIPEYKKVPTNQIVLNWSDDLKPKLLSFVRFWMSGKNRYADVYYPGYSERWEKLENSEDWIHNEEGDTQYPYKEPPINIYMINPDMESLFEAEKGLIDANDKLVNKSLNEVDRFNAMIALLPKKVTKEFVDKLVDMHVIDDLDETDRSDLPRYLEKNLANINEFYNNLSDRLEKLFYQSVKVPNFGDKDFMNADSGIALSYKLLAFEFVASKIDIYFHQGLYHRNKLINDVLDLAGFNTEDYKMIIKAQRNLPVDKKTAVEIASMLHGIVSKETILRMLPSDIVDDVQKELERLDNEMPEDNVNLSIEE